LVIGATVVGRIDGVLQTVYLQGAAAVRPAKTVAAAAAAAAQQCPLLLLLLQLLGSSKRSS
jgi:hypothetical protein